MAAGPDGVSSWALRRLPQRAAGLGWRWSGHRPAPALPSPAGSFEQRAPSGKLLGFSRLEEEHEWPSRGREWLCWGRLPPQGLAWLHSVPGAKPGSWVRGQLSVYVAFQECILSQKTQGGASVAPQSSWFQKCLQVFGTGTGVKGKPLGWVSQRFCGGLVTPTFSPASRRFRVGQSSWLGRRQGSGHRGLATGCP